MRWSVLAVAAACSRSPSPTQLSADASSGGGGVFECDLAIAASCVGASAFAQTTLVGSACQPPANWSSTDATGMATCPNGCALQTSILAANEDEAEVLESNPAAVCAGTPEAQAGDSCSAPAHVRDEMPCVPTRAQLGSDGTVVGQSYLACRNRTCVATAAPTVAGYLTSCNPGDIGSALVGVQPGGGFLVDNQNAVPLFPGIACLFAWDAATLTLSTGATIGCMGDWECPEGSLCDDAIAAVGSGSMPVAICKPGPRGSLTPSMLSE